MYQLIAGFGISAKNHYTLFEGTKGECLEKLQEYPSIQDEGWQDYDFTSSTTIVREICHIEKSLTGQG